MKKTRIEVRANIVNSCKAAQLAIDNQCNKMSNMANSNNKANIYSINIELVKFGVSTQML